MKKYLYVFLVLIVVGFVIITTLHKPIAKEQSAKQPITIGTVLSLTGPAAAFGEQVKNGMTLAADEINKSGGIEGRMVTIVYEDDATDATRAVAAFNKLVSVDKTDAIVGGLWDFIAQPLFPLALNNNITFISPSNFRIAGALEPNKQSFVMMTDFNTVIEKLTGYIKKDTVKKIAVVHFKSNFGNEIAKTIGAIADDLHKNSIVDESYNAIDTNDFKTTIVKLREQHIDTVFLDMVDMDTVNFLTRSKELGFAPTFITYVGSYDGFKPENKSLLEGVIVLNWEKSSDAFIKRYQDMFHTDPAKSANRAYDSVYILAEAVAQSKSDADVASYIESHTFTTPNSSVSFLPTHQAATTPVEIDVYREGKLMPL